MRTKSYALAGQSSSADSVAASQHPVAGTALTLVDSPTVFGSQAVYTTAAPYSGIAVGVPSEITLTPADDATANTYTVVGLDRWGINEISEVISTGTAGDAVTSTKVYSEIISITPSASDSSHDIEAGVPERVTTPWVQMPQTRGFDQATKAFISVDTMVDSPTFVMEATAESLNAFGVGVNGNPNQATYNGDAAPIDYTDTATFSDTTDPVAIPQGAQWARLVITSGTGSSAIARFVRPGF